MKSAAYSLQRRLLTVVLGASSLLWLSSVAIMIDVAWSETGDVFDDGLKETAHLIMATTNDPPAAAPLVETARLTSSDGSTCTTRSSPMGA